MSYLIYYGGEMEFFIFIKTFHIKPISSHMMRMWYILDKIIGLDWNLAHLLRAHKKKMSSLTSHLWPMILVLSMEIFFVKIENSIFPPKYTKYGKNVNKQNSLSQRNLQISWWPFPSRRYIFCLLMKIKNKK